MFLMHAVTESVNTLQDNISYDDNVLYLIPWSRFLRAKYNRAKYNLQNWIQIKSRVETFNKV